MAHASVSPSSKGPMENGRARFHGCSKIQEYDHLGKLGEGTFGEVSKARSKKSGQIVALKKILMHNEKDGFPITALREIKLLKQLDHINILKLDEMAIERSKDTRKKPNMFMVTPYMDHDLSGLLENPAVHFTVPQIKCYMVQLLEGCKYLHENRILHRDMKAANLLINNHGILQIADFGLARPYADDPPKPGQGGGEATREYTTLVVTRWYRPPELLLQLRQYTTAIDMWGVGCVFGEMFKGKPILAGNSDLNQAQLIFDLVGSPTEDNMPGWSELPGCEGVREFAPRNPTLPHVFREQGSLAISLLSELLKLDWRKRINAIDALEHPYFHTQPLPARPGDLPKFEDSHELDRRKFRGMKNKLPPAPAGGSVGVGAQGEWGVNGRPAPYDQRGGNRVPSGRRPYANGHGIHDRRHLPSQPPQPSQDGNYSLNYRPAPGPSQNAAYVNNYRGARGFDDPSYTSRLPPNLPLEDPYSRRALYSSIPPSGLPPKPPPAQDQGWHNAPAHRGDNRGGARDQGPPPRDSARVPPKVDTYIPSYSNASDRERARPPRRDEHSRRDDEYLPPRRDDGYRSDYVRDNSTSLDGRGRYDDLGRRVEDVNYDSRRSRSPRMRDWDRPARDARDAYRR